MAIIGASYPKYAIYANNNGVVSYSNGGIIGKLVDINVALDSAADNDFFADNAIAETDNQFAGGTVTMNTDDLTDEVSKVILGLQSAALTGITGITDEDVEELIYDNRQATPYLGIGFVVKHKKNGAYKWTAVILRKVMFSVPADAAETQGKSIDWQTPELSGTISRDDSEYQQWKSQATFTTEAQAIAYINSRLNIT